MSGDYSRFTDRPRKRYSGVLMQQGRVQLDADWNEEVDLLERRAEVTALDTFGPLAVPAATTPGGFLITSAGSDLGIGAGRIYVDGLLAELFEGEKAGGQPVSYLHQPFFPDPPPLPAGDALVYIDVWHREVTWVEDPDLLEKALGGVDTATRRQTVWQVKVKGVDKAACGAALDAPPTGRLSSRAVAPPASDDPCILSPTGGYRGLENRLYRVEVHTAGDTATARLKWSQENASVVSPVSRIEPDGAASKLTVGRIGRDKVLRFKIDDWVEVLDDHRELMNEPGEMAKVVKIDEAAQTVTLDRAIPAGGTRAFGANALELRARHTRVRRWDQKKNLDADGLVKATTSWIPLGDDGVEVRLSPAGGTFRTGDYWVFAARTVDASVEELAEAPPRGVVQHQGQLAAISNGKASDCRKLWPPKGECCCCTAEVGDGKTSHGDYDDLGKAVEELAGNEKLKGRPIQICLLPGIHVLRETVVLDRDRITIRGCGLGAPVIGPPGKPAFELRAGFCALENLYLNSESRGEGEPAIVCGGVGNRLERNEVVTAGAPAILALDATDLRIVHNRLSHPGDPQTENGAQTGLIVLGSRTAGARILGNDLGPGFTAGILLASTAIEDLLVRDNVLHDLQGSGIDSVPKEGHATGAQSYLKNPLAAPGRIDGLVIERNTITGCVGRLARPRDLPYGGIVLSRVAHVRISDNRIEANGAGPGVETSVAGIYVQRCKGLIVRDNVVIDNGPVRNAKTFPGRQGGILAEDLSVIVESVDVDVSDAGTLPSPLQPDGWPAATIQDNLVVSPRGPALLLTGIGPMRILGNRLTARDLLKIDETPFLYAFAGTVCVLNAGMPAWAVDFLAAAGFQTNNSFEPSTDSGVWTVSGEVELADNQIVLDLIDGQTDDVFTASLLLSLDDVAVQDNQTQCSLYFDWLMVDVLAFGTTVRVTGNGLAESLPFGLVSLWAAAFLMNLVTGNQATHCIRAECLTSKLVDAPNQEILCQSKYRELHFFPQGTPQ